MFRVAVFIKLQRKCNQKHSLYSFIVNLRARTLTSTARESVNTQKRVFVFCKVLISGFQVFCDTPSSTICYTQRSMFGSLIYGPKRDIILALNRSKHGFYFKVSKLYFKCACSGTRGIVYPLNLLRHCRI